MEELRERVAAARRDGLYGDDLSGVGLRMPAPAARVRFRPELAYSSKPVVGAPLTFVKRLILRLLIHVFDDLARQTDAAIGGVEESVRQASVRQASAERAEGIEADVAGLAARIDAIEESLSRLQVGPRLARLERLRREEPAPGEAARQSGPPAQAAASDQGLDYLAFEARFRGAEETVRERQRVYLDHLRGRSRVADLGCGRGELLELLREGGVPAYGVDIEPDFVELVAGKGLDVRREDAVAHLERLAEGALDGVVASHVVEHLPPSVVGRLIAAALRVLPEGGVLILETPNPESLVAGSINFHRDPTHLRPVHPDTLAFLCESAGFAEVRVLRLCPVPDDEQLPVPAPGEGALARHVDRLADRLNGVLYGFQDYAVVARR